MKLFKIKNRLVVAQDSADALVAYLRDSGENMPSLDTAITHIKHGDVSVELTQDNWSAVFPGLPAEASIKAVATASARDWIEHYKQFPNRWGRTGIFVLAREQAGSVSVLINAEVRV